jgi:hypothetical protein
MPAPLFILKQNSLAGTAFYLAIPILAMTDLTSEKVILFQEIFGVMAGREMSGTKLA